MSRRWLRLALLLALTIGIGGGTAVRVSGQSGPITPAWTESNRWGQTGARAFSDSESAPGATCINDVGSNPGSVDIQIQSIRLAPVVGYKEGQTVSVRFLLYQKLQNGTLDLVSRTSYRFQTTYPWEWAEYAPFTFRNRTLGPTYIAGLELHWYDGSDPIGGLNANINYYSIQNLPGSDTDVDAICSSPAATVSSNPTSGIVNSTIHYTLQRFPSNSQVNVAWDGKQLGTVVTSSVGTTTSSLKVPASPIGTHQIRWSAGDRTATSAFTVKPRIKVIPNTVSRGQTVNISLRGFAAREIVRIRWKKDATWFEVARVTTSSTGSANVDVAVPNFVPDGVSSVRGDGSVGRAQTNAVTVSGGPMSGGSTNTPVAASTPVPTATPTATQTPTETPTPTATATPEPTETAEPNESIGETPVLEAPEASPTS